MPLDTTQLDLTRLEATRGFQGAYAYGNEGLVPILENANANQSLAEAGYELWKSGQSFDNADILIARFPNNQAVVTRRAGLVILAEKSFNAGILRQSIKDKPDQPLDTSIEVATDSWSAAQKTTWALAQRFGRIEAARVFEMMLGDYEYVLEVDRNGFAIVDEDGGVERFLEKVAAASKTGNSVEYTLGAPRKRDRRSQHSVPELFGLSADDSWELEENGWPLKVPADVSFDQIKQLASLMTIAARKESLERIDILDGAGRRAFSSTMDKEKQVVEWRRNEPSSS